LPGSPDKAVRGEERVRRLRDALTFSDEIRSTTAAIDRLCARGPDKARFFFDGHVSGIKNLVYDKATDMALLYVATCSGDRDTRLVALERLRDEADNYQGLEMPYNARRILLALVKETVKARGDELQQRRFMAAFHHALSGRAYAVRMALAELGLAEVPEEARSGGGAAGWDDQVYDNAGPGRKTPAQLILDAYIKGLARLTIVYEDFEELEPLFEATRAGLVMGIEVSVGLECLSRAEDGTSFYHVLVPEGCSRPEELAALLEAPSVKRLVKALQANHAEHDRLYSSIASEFNERSLPRINRGFEGTAGELAPLSLESLREQTKGRRLYHVHLGQLLSRRLAQLAGARAALDPSAERLDELPVSELRRRYFEPIVDAALAGSDFIKEGRLYAALSAIETELGSRRVRIAFVRPLERGLEACVAHLAAGAGSIDELEVWNNRSRREGYAEEARFLESLRRALNSGEPGLAESLIASRGIAAPPEAALAAAAARYKLEPLAARTASASDGYNHLAPGMGFAARGSVRNWRAVLRTNRSRLLPVRLQAGGGRDEAVLPLGKDRSAGASDVHRSGAGRLRWRDLNRAIRNSLRMAGGAALSLATGWALSLASGLPMSFGLFAVAAWFAITFSRNYLVDEIARHGPHPSRWRLASFDTTNASNSVFFTFMSIPLLRLIEQLLDRFLFDGSGAGLDPGGVAGRLARFLPLALANGAYIYMHNSLRGFTRGVKRANFLRSALAFPFAVGLSYLNPWPALVPGALVNKIASDLVGGLTEASFKIGREARRARRMYEALLPRLSREPRTKRERYLQRIAILDVLYVWGDMARGKDELRRSIERAAPGSEAREALWEKLEMPVRRYEDFVRLIVDKTQWRKPRRIKLEFLRLAAAFSYWLEKNRGKAAA
jgi:hypothetical protein